MIVGIILVFCLICLLMFNYDRNLDTYSKHNRRIWYDFSVYLKDWLEMDSSYKELSNSIKKISDITNDRVYDEFHSILYDVLSGNMVNYSKLSYYLCGKENIQVEFALGKMFNSETFPEFVDCGQFIADCITYNRSSWLLSFECNLSDIIYV